MKKTVLLLFFIIPFLVYSQDDEIFFSGTKRTSTKWLNSLSDYRDSTSIMESLQNTGLFQQVNAQREDNRLYFDVIEKSYFVPFLGFELSKNHQDYYYLGVSDFNLFGRGIQLYTAAEWFGKVSGEIYVDASRMFRFRHGPIANIKQKNTIEPIYFGSGSYDYDYSLNLGRIGYGYWISPLIQVGITGSYFGESYDYIGVDEIGLPEIDLVEKWNAQLFSNMQRLTYDYEMIEGYRVYLNYDYTNEFKQDFPAHKGEVIGIYYLRPTKKTMVAGRAKLGYSTFNGSPFPPFFVDDFTNVRGAGDRVERGSAETTINLEVRTRLVNKSNIYSQLVVFSDYSTILPSDYKTNPQGFWNYDFYRLGMGLRLGSYRFYNLCLRADASFDPIDWGFSGFVIGVGQYF